MEAITKKMCKYALVSFIAVLLAAMVAACGKYEQQKGYYDGLAAVQAKDGKWGYIDENKNEVIPCTYFVAESFQKGFAIVAKAENEYGLIDKDGREVLPCKYASIQRVHDEGLAIVALNGKYGILNLSGKELVPCEYDSIEFDWDNKKLNASLDKELYTIGFDGTVKARNYKSGRLSLDAIDIPQNTFSFLDTKTAEKLDYSQIVINRKVKSGDLFSPYEKYNVEKTICVMSNGTEMVRFVTNKAVLVQEMDFIGLPAKTLLRYELDDGRLVIFLD